MKSEFLFLFFVAQALISSVGAQNVLQADICVYGATSGGVIAAYSAARAGRTVLLIEPGESPGGLSSGGLGMTDIGNKSAISGIARDFYKQVGRVYGQPEQWTFEPHVAEGIFRRYLQEARVQVRYGYRLVKVEKSGTRIIRIGIDSGGRTVLVNAKVFIDAGYEGDLMAAAGVEYALGREPNSQYQETYNGFQLLDKHQFPDGIDPYLVPGDSSSGLVAGISSNLPGITGAGDRHVQAYNFRLCLTDDSLNRIALERPDGYDSSQYELLARLMTAEPERPFDKILNPNFMPGHKTDINNNGPFSSDLIGASDGYPEADFTAREKIRQQHKKYTLGLLWFIGHDPRMPVTVRTEMLRWGLPKDEFVTTGHWTPQLYIRESRRMKGVYIMTQANCTGRDRTADSIGQAAYTMDSHNCQRIVVHRYGRAMVKNEGDVQIGGFPPYPVSYRAIVPKKEQCSNLLVPVCLSASHIAYGSIRMEPVFMVLGQSAAMAAVMAVENNQAVQDVDVRKLQRWIKTDPLLEKAR